MCKTNTGNDYTFDNNPVYWADPSGADSENNDSGGNTQVDSGVGGIKFDLATHPGNISYSNFSDSYTTVETTKSKLTVGEDNPESFNNLPDGVTVPDETRDYLSGQYVSTNTSTKTTHHEGGNDFIGSIISSINETGKSMKNNSGKTKYGNNKKIYFENKNTGRVFQGNQYTKVRSVSNIGSGIAKRAGLAGNVYSAGTIAYTVYNEGEFGHESQKATIGVLGGMGGAWVGAKAGAWVGAGVGSLFGGVGAIPGAVVGGAIGAVVGTEKAEAGYENFSH